MTNCDGNYQRYISKQRGLNALARFSNATLVQVLLSAITFVALTALVTGLLHLFRLRSEQSDPLPSWLFLIVWLGVPFMLGLIVHRWWAVLITPVAFVLPQLVQLVQLVYNLWQCQAQLFFCLRYYVHEQELGSALFGPFIIVWISIPAFFGWLGFKLRG